MSSLVFLTFSLIFTYSCLSQEGFSGGWTVSLGVDEFSCMFETMIIACPSIHILTLPWLQQTPGVSLLPLPCWCSLPPFLSSCPILLSLCLTLWSLSASVPFLLFPSSTSLLFLLCIDSLLCPPPLFCEHRSGWSAQNNADCLTSASSPLPPAFPADPPQLSPSHCPLLFPALAISCHGLI